MKKKTKQTRNKVTEKDIERFAAPLRKYVATQPRERALRFLESLIERVYKALKPARKKSSGGKIARNRG